MWLLRNERFQMQKYSVNKSVQSINLRRSTLHITVTFEGIFFMLLAARVVVKFAFTEGFSAKKNLEEDVTPTRLMIRLFDTVKIKTSKFLGFQGQIPRRAS